MKGVGERSETSKTRGDGAKRQSERRTYTFPAGMCAPYGVSKSKSNSRSKSANWYGMAIYHFSAQVIGRSSGRSSVAAAAYRLGVSMDDARTGQRHDYTRKGGVDGWEHMTPPGAPGAMTDPAQCWNSVEQVEKRQDAQLCRELNMALPRELTPQQMQELTRAWVGKNCVDRGMVATVAWHHLDGENPHAHVMLSMRELTPEGWGKKARDWNSKEVLEQWRESWGQEANKALELAGSQARIDHRSLKDQGLEQEPQRHMGPKATAIERRGETPARSRYIHPTPKGMDHEQAKREREREQPPVALTPEQVEAKLRAQDEALWKRFGEHLWGQRQEAVAKHAPLALALAEAQAEQDRKQAAVDTHKFKAQAERHGAESAQYLINHHEYEAQEWAKAHPWRERFGLRPPEIKRHWEKVETLTASRDRKLARAELADAEAEAARPARDEAKAAAGLAYRAEREAWKPVEQADNMLRQHSANDPEKKAQMRARTRELERRRIEAEEKARAAYEQAHAAGRGWQHDWEQTQPKQEDAQQSGRWANLATPTPPWVPKPRGIGRGR